MATRTTISVPDGRVPNLPWAKKGYCPTCEDTGYVIVTCRVSRRIVRENGKEVEKQGGPFEEMGPCPKCAHGFCVEFALGRRTEQKGKATVTVEVQGTPVWGRDGYWMRNPDKLATIEPPSWSALLDAPTSSRAVPVPADQRPELSFD